MYLIPVCIYTYIYNYTLIVRYANKVSLYVHVHEYNINNDNNREIERQFHAIPQHAF